MYHIGKWLCPNTYSCVHHGCSYLIFCQSDLPSSLVLLSRLNRFTSCVFKASCYTSNEYHSNNNYLIITSTTGDHWADFMQCNLLPSSYCTKHIYNITKITLSHRYTASCFTTWKTLMFIRYTVPGIFVHSHPQQALL